METTQRHILLVEDNPGDAEIISEIITQAAGSRFKLYIRTRLADALRFLAQTPVDIVLLDLGLPDSKGLDALTTIKRSFSQIPVVVITGNENESIGLKAVKNGAQDYILKGMIPNHYLTQVIEYAIQRQDIEYQLKQSKEKYRTIVEHIGIGVALISNDRTVLEANEKMMQWFPRLKSEDPVFCHGAIQCLCEGDPEHTDCPVARTLSDGNTHKGTSRSGNVTYRILSSPIKDDAGTIKGAILLKEDITERLSIEAKLRQAQKMESLGTLAGGVAHDFNNILTAIQGFASLARYDTDKTESLIDDLNEILKASQRASELVRQILTFSRMTEFEKRPIRVDLIIREALKLLRSTLPSNIEIRNQVEKLTDMVVADPTQIHQIMMNLCTNAAHAMEEKGGTLSISLSRENLPLADSAAPAHLDPGPYLVLMVQDTGTGIPDHIMDSIFDPYFTTKGIGDGTGLGLSVVQGIVQDSGGEITASSTFGKGSCFSVFLPIAQDRSMDAAPPVSRDDRKGTGTLLVVDDEPSILKMINRMLKNEGYTIHTRSNGQDALAFLNGHPGETDLVISDMTMPQMTGLELAEKMREAGHKTPVIIMTGYSRMLTPENLEKYQIQAVIEKPLNPDKLARGITAALGSGSEETA